jgi:heat-inducible transcriptional repressor
VRSVQLVGLTDQVALLVVVLSNGAVAKHTVELGPRAGEDGPVGDELDAASALLAEALVGGELSRARTAQLPDVAGAEVARIALGLVAEADRTGEHVFTAGTSMVAQAFDAVATVREVLRLLEEQYVMVGLLRDVLDRGLDVAIGTETGLEPLADCSVVVAPYLVAGERAGTIGILGPTRMDYPQALAAVAVVSRRLGETLSEG